MHIPSPSRRPLLRTLGALAAAAAFGSTARARATPNRILVGFPADGNMDVVARVLADEVLAIGKQQPARGGSGTKTAESQFASIVRAAGGHDPLGFV